MADYKFRETEVKWQQYWQTNQTYAVKIDTSKPKFYVLDMFPYPSGAGLHVGHPLGYIASDVVARYKNLQGYNVLHPMGFDAFGLPAEQYAIQTGQHPAITTAQNIARYKEQLYALGFSYDWNREVRTSDPEYYKWTQWIFIQLFESWYNTSSDKAEPIQTLITLFENEGNYRVKAVTGEEETSLFTAAEWKNFTDFEQQKILLNYRLAYLAETTVNWCPALGTVLANEEIKDGLSERGGHPVIRKNMQQWSLRISAYTQRLLNGLEDINWPEPIKEIQRNWIGRSAGVEVTFELESGFSSPENDHTIKVFTTRPDTLFGVCFLVLAPEHELVPFITTTEYKQQINNYIHQVSMRSERERMSDVKTITGQFTGAYAMHPFTGEKLPIWIADYVLAGYGTGAVMAVPAHDSRDHAFALHFGLPIKEVIAGGDVLSAAFEEKSGTVINSGFLDGLNVQDAITACIAKLEEENKGKGRINYRLRDAICSRQRYWGEPIPIYYENGLPKSLPIAELPLLLPEVDAYLPTETGEPPLGRADDWLYKNQFPFELSTMPGWAGSSWYYLRYMDPDNDNAPVSKEKEAYWGSVDLYMGGAEHATGHLLYARFWYEFLKDLGLVTHKAPFTQLLNQGMIQGVSQLVYKTSGKLEEITINSKTYNFEESVTICLSADIVKHLNNQDQTDIKVHTSHVPVECVRNGVLNIEELIKKLPLEFSNCVFLSSQGYWKAGSYHDLDAVESLSFTTVSEVEKMSKSKHNVVNPDDIINEYGADTLRLYEMFLGPIEQAKPWNTNGIEGVYKFLRKYWRLFHNAAGDWAITNEKATPEELKSLHKTLKKVAEDIERLSFNTPVSTFMICVNELTALGCHKREILEPLTIALSSYAPHITEEVWQRMGHTSSITKARYPMWDEKYLTEDSFEYPVSVNGKTKTKMRFALDIAINVIEKQVLSSEEMQRYLDGKTPKKVIVVKGKIINVVV